VNLNASLVTIAKRTRDPHSTAGTDQKKKRHKTENGAVLHAFPYPDSEGGPATLSNSSKSDKTKRAKSKRASTSKRKHKTEPKKRTKKEVKSDQPEDVPEQCNGTNEKPSKVCFFPTYEKISSLSRAGG